MYFGRTGGEFPSAEAGAPWAGSRPVGGASVQAGDRVLAVRRRGQGCQGTGRALRPARGCQDRRGAGSRPARVVV